MSVIIYIIGAIVFIIGLCLIYSIRKQSKIYTSSIVKESSEIDLNNKTEYSQPNIVLNQNISSFDMELLKHDEILLTERKIFNQAIVRHITKHWIQSSIYSSFINIDINHPTKEINSLFNIYENNLNKTKFSNLTSLYRILYKTEFSKGVLEALNTSENNKKDRIIIGLYSELIRSLMIYEDILNNESKYNADIINYDVAINDYRFHYDIPENKLNQVMVYINSSDQS